MGIDQAAFHQIATTLARHYDSIYFVDIETGSFTAFVPPRLLAELKIPSEGDDFFALARQNAHIIVHPDDLDRAVKLHDKAEILRQLSHDDSFTACIRLAMDGKIIHVRQVYLLCDDRQHVVCCMENIEKEYIGKEEPKQADKSAERLARMDKLTGVKNRAAFDDFAANLDEKVGTGAHDGIYAVVVCNINDLKYINDAKGRSFGDEAIQQASRMVCNTFTHSPVFRVGEDEFVAVLSGGDYEARDQLLDKLREESRVNGLMHSGPVLAAGMAIFDSDRDEGVASVFEKAGRMMRENKESIKDKASKFPLKKAEGAAVPEAMIPSERKKQLDGMFASLFTVSEGGYIFLIDLRFEYSRWSLAMVDDFGLRSEYLHHATKIIQERIHPDDLESYNESVNAAIFSGAAVKPISFRLHNMEGAYIPVTARCFVQCDSKGNPEYFGGKLVLQ